MTKKRVHVSAEEEQLLEDLLAKRLSKQEPSAQFRDALFGKLVREHFAQPRLAPEPKHSFFEGIHFLFRRVSAFSIACMCLMVGSGIATTFAYVSPDVHRESNLYFIKRFIERVELTVATSPEWRSRLHLKLAERRLQEAEVLSESGKLDTETINEVVQETTLAHQEVERAAPEVQPVLHELVAEKSKKQRKQLVALVEEQRDDPPPPPPPAPVFVETQTGTVEEVESVEIQAQSEDVAKTIAFLEEKIQDISEVEIAAKEDAGSNESYIEPVVSDDVVEENNTEDTIVNEDKDPDPLPAFTDISIAIPDVPTLKTGPSHTIMVDVYNKGARDSYDLQLEVNWGTYTSYKMVGVVTAGQKRSIALHQSFAEPGEYTLTVVADPYEELIEQITANNRASTTISVEQEFADECEEDAPWQCTSDGHIERCSRWNGNGHRTWKMIIQCEDGCENGACIEKHECIQSYKTCAVEGELTCQKEVELHECVRDAHGCLYTEKIKNCVYGCTTDGCASLEDSLAKPVEETVEVIEEEECEGCEGSEESEEEVVEN